MTMKFLLAVFEKEWLNILNTQTLYRFSTFIQIFIIEVLTNEIFEAFLKKVLFSQMLSAFMNYLVQGQGKPLPDRPRKSDQF